MALVKSSQLGHALGFSEETLLPSGSLNKFNPFREKQWIDEISDRRLGPLFVVIILRL